MPTVSEPQRCPHEWHSTLQRRETCPSCGFRAAIKVPKEVARLIRSAMRREFHNAQDNSTRMQQRCRPRTAGEMQELLGKSGKSYQWWLDTYHEHLIQAGAAMAWVEKNMVDDDA